MEDTVDVEDLERIIKESINETLHAKPGEKEVQYKEEKTEQWSNQVMDKCLAKLAGRESKYKYSVTCVLMQKNGAGLVTSSSQYWEKHDADLYVPVPWENNSIHCIVTIFAMKAFPSDLGQDDMPNE